MEALLFPDVFSVEAFSFEFPQWNGEGQRYTYYAIAVNGAIAWDIWPGQEPNPHKGMGLFRQAHLPAK
jgi:hypothetical protein